MLVWSHNFSFLDPFLIYRDILKRVATPCLRTPSLTNSTWVCFSEAILNSVGRISLAECLRLKSTFRRKSFQLSQYLARNFSFKRFLLFLHWLWLFPMMSSFILLRKREGKYDWFFSDLSLTIFLPGDNPIKEI